MMDDGKKCKSPEKHSFSGLFILNTSKVKHQPFPSSIIHARRAFPSSLRACARRARLV
jgi:hypothetical protein